MRESRPTLGILVNSNRHFDYVLQLAEAAAAKGKQVRIHVLEKGMGLFASGQFIALSRLAQITTGTSAMDTTAFGESLRFPDTVRVVSARQFTDVLGECDRTVVF